MIEYFRNHRLLCTAALLFIGVNFFLASWYLIHGDIVFTTDIARDFLLLQDIVTTHKPTLIGPRSGGISGFFHGPLWIYLNIPFFVLGAGNPVVVGWFWVLLVICASVLVFYSAKKIFDIPTALLATSLFSLTTIDYTKALFNPFGAVMLSPIFFYFFYKFSKQYRMVDLCITLLLLGFMIQFQIAFAGPVLFLVSLFVLYSVVKKRKPVLLLAYGMLIIPLSTYALFEVRHDFLQLKAIIQFVSSDTKDALVASQNTILGRANQIINSLMIVPYPNIVMKVVVTAIFAWLAITVWKDKKMKNRQVYLLYFYLFAGYWICALLFKGVVWSYYYWPFLPLNIIIFSSFLLRLDKKIIAIFAGVLLVQVALYYSTELKNASNFIGKDTGSWLFNRQLAQSVYSYNDTDFGYYIFTPDQFGYSPRYAMDYEKMFHGTTQHPYEKKTVTYLILAPGIEKNVFEGGDWWKKNRVHITKTPQDTTVFENKFRVERYILTEKEIQVASDPTIVNSLFFR